jgi:hypothetical protein
MLTTFHSKPWYSPLLLTIFCGSSVGMFAPVAAAIASWNAYHPTQDVLLVQGVHVWELQLAYELFPTVYLLFSSIKCPSPHHCSFFFTVAQFLCCSCCLCQLHHPPPPTPAPFSPHTSTSSHLAFQPCNYTPLISF